MNNHRAGQTEKQMKKRFISIGECMVEMSTRDAEHFNLGFAGDALNTAWYTRAAIGSGWDVDFVSALGDDIYSAQMRDFFLKHQIGTDHIKTLSGKRPGLYIIHQAKGDRHFTYWRENSAARLLANDPETLNQALDGAGLIYFSGVTLAIIGETGRTNLLTAIALARQNGAKIAFDSNIRPALWPHNSALTGAIEDACSHVDIALPTFDDEAVFFGDASPQITATRYFSYGVKEVVVKNGPGLALVATQDETFEVPANPVTAIDATGAGDSFNGAYLAARESGLSLLESAKTAHRVAAIVVTHPGALVAPSLLKLPSPKS